MNACIRHSVHQLNYFLLERLVGELRPRLLGAAFVEAITLGKGELGLRFEGLALRIGFGVPSYCLPHDALPHPRRHRRAFFEGLAGQTVSEVELISGERILRIGLSSGAALGLLLHGARGNAIAVNDGLLVGSFRRRGVALGEPYSWPAPRPLPDTAAAWAERLAQTGGERTRALPAFDKTLWQAVDALGGDWQAIGAVLQRARTGPIAVDATARPPRLQLAADAGFATATDALAAWAQAWNQQQGIDGQRAALAEQLSEALRRLERQATRLRHEHTQLENARSNEELGHLVLAQLHRFAPTAPQQPQVQLDDFYTGGHVTLPWPAGESGQAMAERLYARHRQDLLRRSELPLLLERLERRRQRLARAADELGSVPSLRRLGAWHTRWAALLPPAAASATAVRKPYRRFLLGGYEVRVGRSAADNDALTLRHARPNDLWLHAKDVSGSHVVIVNPTRGVVPTPVLEQAAALAAWYSKQRGATLAAVSVTPRKYVRKGKGMAAGQVRLEREQTLLVAPRDPATWASAAEAADAE